MKKLLFLVACLSQLIVAGEVDQYFNGGNAVWNYTNYAEAVPYAYGATSGYYESGVAVDFYDDVVTYYYDSSARTLTVTKINEKGELVSDFGTSGVVTTVFDGTTVLSNFCITTNQSDGNITIAYSEANTDYSTFSIKFKRFDRLGVVDDDFESSVDASISVPDGYDLYNLSGVFVDSLGGMILVGLVETATSHTNQYAAAWLLDSYGWSGDAQLRDLSSYGYVRGYDLGAAIDSEDNIYVGGIYEHSIGVEGVFVMKLVFGIASLSLRAVYQDYSESSLLSIMGASKKVKVVEFEKGTIANVQTIVYSDDRYVVMYQNHLSNLAADTTFSGDGHAYVSISYSVINDAVRNSEGDLLLSGVKSGWQLVVARITKNGHMDSTFGNWGHAEVAPFSGGDVSSARVAVDSGDGLVIFTVEKDFSDNYFGTQRILAADHVNKMFHPNLLHHADLVELLHYSHSLDYLQVYLSGVNSSLSSYGNSVVVSFDTAMDVVFNEAIARANANGFPGSFSMKYKRGVAKREIDTAFPYPSSSVKNAVDAAREVVAVEFDNVRAELISA